MSMLMNRNINVEQNIRLRILGYVPIFFLWCGRPLTIGLQECQL